MTINFINTPPPDKQQAVYQWYRMTMNVAALLCVLFLLTNAYQFYQIKAADTSAQELKQVTEHINIASERIKQLTTIHEQLKVQEASLSAHETKKFKPALYLRTIATTIPADTCLFIADLHKKKNIQLSGYTESAHSLQQFIEALRRSRVFGSLELTSLQPESTQQVTHSRFTLTAQLQNR